MRSYTHLAGHGGMLKLCNVGPRVREVLEVTHLDSIIHMFDSEGEALRSFPLTPH